MNAFTDRSVEFLIGIFPVQMGKTEVLLNALGYIVDQEPGPGLIVYPTEKDAKKVLKNRIHPLFTFNQRLKRHILGGTDALGLDEMRFSRCVIYPAWSNSPSAMASTPCRYVFLDEVDKFPPFAGREASPLKLSEMRTRTFRGRRKICIFSTPTTDEGYIFKEWLRSNQQTFHVPCPRCSRFQVFDFFKGLKWPEGSTAEGLKAAQNAWYQCEACELQIPNQGKFEMVSRGRWVPAGVTITDRGELEGEAPSRLRTGFHINAISSPWVTFSDIGAEFLDAKDDRGRLMNFFNSTLALPWREKVETIKDVHLRKRKRDYISGHAPPGGLRVVAGVDVQADHIWYVIRAWGEGERSWLLRWGRVETFKELAKVLFISYRCGTLVLKVERVLVDSGHRTDEVYKFCKKHRPTTYPAKGQGGLAMISPAKVTRPHPGVVLFNFKADYWKDKLARFIQTEDDEPGAWYLPDDVAKEYLDQMISEHRIPKRYYGRTFSTWEPLTEHTPNHYFDCEVLVTVAADSIGVRYLEEDPEAEAEPAPPPATPPGEQWLEGGSGWMGGGSIWE